MAVPAAAAHRNAHGVGFVPSTGFPVTRLLLAAAVAASTVAVPATIASAAIDACAAERCVGTDPCTAVACPQPVGDCTWVRQGNIWVGVCW